MPDSTRSSRPRRYRVVIGLADPDFRDALVSALQELGTVDVAGVAGSGSDTVIDAFRHRPDVVLLDLGLPGMSAAETTRHIGRAAPTAAVCLLVESEFDRGISEALDAGARDCLHRRSTPEEMAIILQRVSVKQ